jgi:hypothetical protein
MVAAWVGPAPSIESRLLMFMGSCSSDSVAESDWVGLVSGVTLRILPRLSGWLSGTCICHKVLEQKRHLHRSNPWTYGGAVLSSISLLFAQFRKRTRCLGSNLLYFKRRLFSGGSYRCFKKNSVSERMTNEKDLVSGLTKVLHKIKNCCHASDCRGNARFGESILYVGLDRSPGSSSKLVYCLRMHERVH